MAKKKVRATQKKKVIWALDPFSGDEGIYKKTAPLVRFIGEKQGWAVEPTYVLSPDGFNWTGDFSAPWVDKFKPVIEESMTNILQKTSMETLPPRILVHSRLSLRGDVKKLMDYAKKHSGQLVVLNTHARSGLSRMVLGSFAETAALYAKLPLLMINPQATVPSAIKRILYPTDLTSDSKKTFKKIIKLASQWGASIVLMHKLPDPIEPVLQTGVHMAGGGWVSVNQYLDREQKSRHEECEKLAAAARKAGVDCQVEIEDRPGFVADTILGVAKEKSCDLIAVASNAGPVSAILIGSVARQLMRQSEIPIWVQHFD